MSGTLNYECGCVNTIDDRCGAVRSVLKCDHHKSLQRETGELGEEYYRGLGALDADAQKRYRHQFEDGLGLVPEAMGPMSVLEIGAGASSYRPLFKNWQYSACEPSQWACGWLHEHYPGIAVWCGDWGTMYESNVRFQMKYDAILCAHALEHMADAPTALVQMAECLEPGGVLYILIPDGDDDQINPDHLFFFNRLSLARAVEAAGLTIERVEVRKYVPHEHFIYMTARNLS